MSVLLTAVKKKGDKPKMIKRSSTSSLSNQGPPTSNSQTTVWYWNLQGVLTTVMYTEYSRELWCNGVTLTTAMERYDPLMGRVTDFMINLAQTGSVHQGHVVHLPEGHLLYVDGYLIPEHTG